MIKSDLSQTKVGLAENTPSLFNTKKWFIIAFSIFLGAALIGLIMRYIFVGKVPFLNYKHLLHAHSHIALMGWAYMLVAGGVIYFFNRELHLGKVVRNTLFFNTISVIGMTITFILQGYAFESIAFSTLHLVVGFYFGINVLRKLKPIKNNTAQRFLKWSIYWYMLSSLGLLAIGPVSSKLGPLHPMYTASIQFFIHFQFNGWFIFGALAIVFKFLENQGQIIRFSTLVWSFLIASVPLTYILSITPSAPLDALFILIATGVILQGIAYAFILFRAIKSLKHIKLKSPLVRTILTLGIGSLIAKVLMQLTFVSPSIAIVSYTINNFVIGFIHLIMLGSITFTISSLLIYEGVLPFNKTARYGWIILALGFVLTELILFGQGSLFWMNAGFIPGYYEILFAASTLLPIGIAIILLSYRRGSILNTEI